MLFTLLVYFRVKGRGHVRSAEGRACEAWIWWEQDRSRAEESFSSSW